MNKCIEVRAGDGRGCRGCGGRGAERTISSSRKSRSASQSATIIKVSETHMSHVSADAAKLSAQRKVMAISVIIRRALQRGRYRAPRAAWRGLQGGGWGQRMVSECAVGVSTCAFVHARNE